MLEMLRKSFLAGLGAVVVTRDKIRDATKTLVEEGKITSDEAERFADDLVKSGEREWEDVNSKIQSSMKKLSENVDVVRKKDVQDMRARIELLEQRVKLLEEAGCKETGILGSTPTL
ncbi:MAG: hypothetical protein AAGU11_24070 [Syntrophobacteraceae bacterium]